MLRFLSVFREHRIFEKILYIHEVSSVIIWIIENTLIDNK